MSEADSFIDEVNEEVRREKLFRTFRKYGWIGILAVVIIVGGAAVNEYRKASALAAAEALGDSIIAALELPGAPARIGALGEIEASGQVETVIELLVAAEQTATDDPEAAVATLTPLASNPDIPAVYSDLAAFKIILLGGESVTPELRAQLLDRLATPGAPYRPLALEQQVLTLAANGETEAAIEAARALLQEPQLTRGLLDRVTQLMLALGAEIGDVAG
ncbi:hypothetical protein [Aliiruegeria lutimaris]|uniref:Tetratricopeptide repeat-like domain-containing protein n=1 Tax=Aliiruegeria lutimaris TaxID=571298 RepID=A0A1G8TR02_9RHOB|nr:hypothetical protein [Aliiruegeria lutimaris]SDJ43972.1 hypothetical protein SAMN04488026_101772 [Aliiruegeria lutimaris]